MYKVTYIFPLFIMLQINALAFVPMPNLDEALAEHLPDTLIQAV
jgi:hypothetical protein